VVRVPDAAWESMHLHLLLVHSAERESETTVFGPFYLSAVCRHYTEGFNHRAFAHVKLSFQSAISRRPDRIIFTYPRTASCPLLQSARHTPSILFASSRIARWCRTGIARHLQIGDLHDPQTHNLDTVSYHQHFTKRPHAQQGLALHT
jgi:hypothetical protein